MRGSVELVVLRPPTLEALGKALSDARAAGEPFQVVHFDGHGELIGRGGAVGSGDPLTSTDPAAQGVLVFERPGGGPEEVPAADVAQVLAAAQVPVVVLNACQSGAVGKQLEAAVATRLLQEGAASVVAMAYTVYAVAAAEFMAAFYERLFAGDRVTDAVSAGRRRLARRDERPSPKGNIPLADWVVPVHYLRCEVRFPDLQADPAPELSLDEMLDRLRDRAVEDPGAALAPVDAFVGRDGLFYTLEVAARHQRVVVLHGPGGAGKTELAKAFGRWWRDTGGVDRPEWVIWHSFKPGVASFGLAGVVAEIGLRVFGPDFARLDPAKRREVVQQLLSQRRLLLIWDNFESVHAMPDPAGATPPLDAAGRDELKSFLQRVAAEGTSAVLVTSRTKESWLGGLCRIPVGGLAPDEAIEYADQVLAPYPAAVPRRAKRAFAELMEWFGGHPLSMRVVLPYLDTTEPEVLLTGLRGIAALPGVDVLAAGVTYSYDHLATNTRRLLVAVSLFQGVADVNILYHLCRVPGVPSRFHGWTTDDLIKVVDRAARVGLLTPLGGPMYGIHPALPAYLADQWRHEEPDDYDQQRATAEAALLDVYAALGAWLLQQIHGGDAEVAFAVIDQQRRMLGSLLGYALDHGQWYQAGAIAMSLEEYWTVRGLGEESRGWVDRARLTLETADGTPPALDEPAGGLWLIFVTAQASRQLTAHQLEAAEHTYLKIHDMFQQLPESRQQPEILAHTYRDLGQVAQLRGLLEDAEDWYRKSLTIYEKRGDRLGIAGSYHRLGRVAQDRGRLEDAEDWYLKSLTIYEEIGYRSGIADSYFQLGVVACIGGCLENAEDWCLKSLTIYQERGDRPRMAGVYHELGNVAHDRGHLEDAESWYLKSLTISEELGNRPGMAGVYHELGLGAQNRGRLEDAESWYRKSLTMYEELGDQPHTATGYHMLGRVAQLRGHPEDAEGWYRESLAIKEELGDRLGMVNSYQALGSIADSHGRLEEAMEWIVRSVALVDEGSHPDAKNARKNLVLMTAKLGIDTLERCWHRVTGEPLPRAVRDFIGSGRPEDTK